MASVLQEAEQQGILDVYLAKITHHSQHEVVHRMAWQRGRADTETAHELFSETSVSDWRKLDGSKPGWEQQPVCFQSTSHDSNDFLMQVSSLQNTERRTRILLSCLCFSSGINPAT